MKKKLCVTCNSNDNYYPIYNKTSEFIDCYNDKTIEGYFLDTLDKEYKPCYQNCKKCSELGTITEQKCISCYMNFTLNDTIVIKYVIIIIILIQKMNIFALLLMNVLKIIIN